MSNEYTWPVVIIIISLLVMILTLAGLAVLFLALGG